MKPFAILPLLLSLGLPLMAHNHAVEPEITTHQQQQSMEVKQAWVRAAQHNQITAAFIQLQSQADNQLIAVHSDVAEFNEIHTHSMVDGMMQMREIDQIDLPAGDWVSLQPGGLHLMLINLHHDLLVGEQLPLQLSFANGEQLTFQFDIKERTYLPEASQTMDGHQGH